MMAALDARQRFQLSYWDAAIIEASRALGCTHVLSEDLSDGQDYGGVQVTNPFRELFRTGEAGGPADRAGLVREQDRVIASQVRSKGSG